MLFPEKIEKRPSSPDIFSSHSVSSETDWVENRGHPAAVRVGTVWLTPTQFSRHKPIDEKTQWLCFRWARKNKTRTRIKLVIQSSIKMPTCKSHASKWHRNAHHIFSPTVTLFEQYGIFIPRGVGYSPNDQGTSSPDEHKKSTTLFGFSCLFLLESSSKSKGISFFQNDVQKLWFKQTNMESIYMLINNLSWNIQLQGPLGVTGGSTVELWMSIHRGSALLHCVPTWTRGVGNFRNRLTVPVIASISTAP